MCMTPGANAQQITAPTSASMMRVAPAPGGMGAAPHIAGAPQAATPAAAPQFAVPGAPQAPAAQPDPTIIQAQPEPKAVDPATATIGSVFANTPPPAIPALSTAPQVLMNAYNAGASSPY